MVFNYLCKLDVGVCVIREKPSVRHGPTQASLRTPDREKQTREMGWTT